MNKSVFAFFCAPHLYEYWVIFLNFSFVCNWFLLSLQQNCIFMEKSSKSTFNVPWTGSQHHIDGSYEYMHKEVAGDELPMSHSEFVNVCLESSCGRWKRQTKSYIEEPSDYWTVLLANGEIEAKGVRGRHFLLTIFLTPIYHDMSHKNQLMYLLFTGCPKYRKNGLKNRNR